MNTFLPFPDINLSAQCLDDKRLGKQRVECYQILHTLKTGGHWSKHPAVKMWTHSTGCLYLYSLVVCQKWRQRGFKDTLLERIQNEFGTWVTGGTPWWWDGPIHASHRASLYRKDPVHYGQFAGEPWTGYVWPDPMRHMPASTGDRGSTASGR
jgi:hypothetical protein